MYRVSRIEVNSTIQEGRFNNRRSLQGEAKNIIVGFDPGIPLKNILKQVDQYFEDGQAYRFEEVSAFASRLDTQIRQATSLGAELLPDEDAVDRHLSIIFYEGLKETVEDKTCYRKDSCKTFANLARAFRDMEKEIISAHNSRKLARLSQMTGVHGANWDPQQG